MFEWVGISLIDQHRDQEIIAILCDALCSRNKVNFPVAHILFSGGYLVEIVRF